LTKSRSKSNDRASSNAKPVGFSPESKEPETFDSLKPKTDTASASKAENMVAERVMREVKTIGQDLNEEAVENISTTQAPVERIDAQKVRSKSTERASIQGNSVGYVAAEEEPEFFEDKFKVKRSKATFKRTKSLANERASNIEANQGYVPKVEPCETVDDFKAKLKT